MTLNTVTILRAGKINHASAAVNTTSPIRARFALTPVSLRPSSMSCSAFERKCAHCAVLSRQRDGAACT
ncbi:MAG: hypothetical protein ABI386_04670, partial [Rhodanobacter sp.]